MRSARYGWEVKILRAWTSAAALLAILATPESLELRAQAPARAIVLSCDGVAPSFLLELLRQEKMPNLARLIAGGAFADSVITTFPSETAAGHASLWTGAPPRLNGISGNRLPRTPRSQFTILESVSGFHSTALRAEPLWISAARAGRRSLVVQATQGWPFEPYAAQGRFGAGESVPAVLFEGYAGVAGRDGVVTAAQAKPRAAEGWANPPRSLAPPLELSFTVGATRLFGLFIDDPADPARGYDTLLITRVKDGLKAETRLKAGASAAGQIHKWSPTIEVETSGERGAGTSLRLFELKSDGSDFLLYFTAPARALGSRPELLPALRQAAGGFIGNGASRLYGQGTLGIPIPRGGDGRAERRYLETALRTQRHLMDAARWAVQTLPWDHLFTYSPYPDEGEHLWRGYLEAGLAGFQQDVADRLRPFLEELYRGCDDFVGLLMAARPPDTIIALVSDHGMEGVNKAVSINAALRRAGLLVLDRQSHVDLTKTKALYPAINATYILINTTDHKGGIVTPEERPEVAARIRRALEEIRDGGKQVVTAIIDAQTEGAALGIGGEAGGDLYLDLLPGYDFDAGLGQGELIVDRRPLGEHGFNPERPSMRTVLMLNGPGVAAGRRVREARTIDFAPTLARLLGMAAPRDATGRVLAEALSR